VFQIEKLEASQLDYGELALDQVVADVQHLETGEIGLAEGSNAGDTVVGDLEDHQRRDVHGRESRNKVNGKVDVVDPGHLPILETVDAGHLIVAHVVAVQVGQLHDMGFTLVSIAFHMDHLDGFACGVEFSYSSR